MTPTETWAPVPLYEGFYEVSCFGRFRRVHGGIIATTVSPHNGYAYVRLSAHGVAKNYRAHRLVLMAHEQPPHDKAQVRHLDGDKCNNNITNLQWGTASENAEDKRAHGTLKGAHAGADHHNAKLDERAVAAIIYLWRDGYEQKVIAAAFGICQSNVSRIVNGRTWTVRNANARDERRMSR